MLFRSAAFWLGLNLLLALLIGRIVRRDVSEIERLVGVAAEIAAGAHSVDIPTRATSREVRELASTLHKRAPEGVV